MGSFKSVLLMEKALTDRTAEGPQRRGRRGGGLARTGIWGGGGLGVFTFLHQVRRRFLYPYGQQFGAWSPGSVAHGRNGATAGGCPVGEIMHRAIPTRQPKQRFLPATRAFAGQAICCTRGASTTRVVTAAWCRGSPHTQQLVQSNVQFAKRRSAPPLCFIAHCVRVSTPPPANAFPRPPPAASHHHHHRRHP